MAAFGNAVRHRSGTRRSDKVGDESPRDPDPALSGDTNEVARGSDDSDATGNESGTRLRRSLLRPDANNARLSSVALNFVTLCAGWLAWRFAGSTLLALVATGLSIVKSPVDRRGGRIELKSRAGTGTAVVVSLPLAG